MSCLPTLIPPVAYLGVPQDIVVKYSQELPHCQLITLHVLEKRGKSVPIYQLSTQSLGSRAVECSLPAFSIPGEYFVVLKFDKTERENFPPFCLRVLSPLETMQHCIPSTSEHTDKPSLLAAILAYLIRYDVSSGGEELPPVTDRLLCTTLQSMYFKKLPVISIPAFLCDKYYCGHESLLHFALRHHLEETCTFLLREDIISNYKGLLDTKGYDTKSPLQLAQTNGMHMIAKTIQELMLNSADTSRDETCSCTSQDEAHPFDRAVSAVQFLTTKVPRRCLKPFRKRHTKKHAVSSRKLLRDKVSREKTEYKITSPMTEYLYTAKVKENCTVYFTETKTSLQVKTGDVVQVIKDQDGGFCEVLINGMYCEIQARYLEKCDPEKMEPFLDSDDNYSESSSPVLPHMVMAYEFEDAEDLLFQEDLYLQLSPDIKEIKASNAEPRQFCTSLDTGLDAIGDRAFPGHKELIDGQCSDEDEDEDGYVLVQKSGHGVELAIRGAVSVSRKHHQPVSPLTSPGQTQPVGQLSYDRPRSVHHKPRPLPRKLSKQPTDKPDVSPALAARLQSQHQVDSRFHRYMNIENIKEASLQSRTPPPKPHQRHHHPRSPGSYSPVSDLVHSPTESTKTPAFS